MLVGQNGIVRTPDYKWRVLAAKLAIPFGWLVISLCFEIIMFARMGWGFLPSGFLMSFALMLVLALVFSCIPNRIVQLVIFSVMLLMQGAILLSNIGAQANLGEFFQWENLLAITEVWASMESAQLAIFLELFLLIGLYAIYLTMSIIVIRRLRSIRAGYRWRGAVAVALIISLSLGAKATNAAALPAVYGTWVENEHNSRFVFHNFSHRENYLRRFGSFSFYTRNLLHMMGINPLFNTELPPVDFKASNWQLDAAISQDPDEWLLDENYNLVMILMETVELDAIHPLLMPNLYRIQGMSTWVDGLYSHERTAMNEYVALVGSHLQGVEMWHSYSQAKTPQSFAHMFREAGHDQMGAFHNFDRTFYSRDQFFTPERNGFDWIKDMGCVGGVVHNNIISSNMNRNSDRIAMENAQWREALLPNDKTFFNFWGNIAPHSPHFNSSQTFPMNTRNRYTGARQNGRPIYEDGDSGRWRMDTSPDFEEELIWVLENEQALIEHFPKLNFRDSSGRINNELRSAVIAYMVGLRDFDAAMGIFMDRLENTRDYARDPYGHLGGLMLADTTAVVLFSDHFNFVAYGHPSNPGGGLLSKTTDSHVAGERLSFMIMNPRCRTEHRIERFMANMDVYATVAHLFQIQTYSKFTLGVSVLDPSTVSLGVGFVTSIYTWWCPETRRHFATRDFVTFYDQTELRGGRLRNVPTRDLPSREALDALMARAEKIIAAMFWMRPIYRSNTILENIPDGLYVLGAARRAD